MLTRQQPVPHMLTRQQPVPHGLCRSFWLVPETEDLVVYELHTYGVFNLFIFNCFFSGEIEVIRNYCCQKKLKLGLVKFFATFLFWTYRYGTIGHWDSAEAEARDGSWFGTSQLTSWSRIRVQMERLCHRFVIFLEDYFWVVACRYRPGNHGNILRPVWGR